MVPRVGGDEGEGVPPTGAPIVVREAETHVVARGDTLGRIAAEFGVQQAHAMPLLGQRQGQVVGQVGLVR